MYSSTVNTPQMVWRNPIEWSCLRYSVLQWRENEKEESYVQT